MTYDQVVEMIRRHEGYSEKVYLDTVGVPTVGYGHALIVGSHIPPEVGHSLLHQDIRIAWHDYDTLDLDIDSYRKGVVVNMLFNLGRPRLLKFKKFLAALREKDYDLASKEMLDSKWATQVKGRAVELAEMMEKGETV